MSSPFHAFAQAGPSELPGRLAAPAFCPRGSPSTVAGLLDQRPLTRLLPLLDCELLEGKHIIVINCILSVVSTVLVTEVSTGNNALTVHM